MKKVFITIFLFFLFFTLFSHVVAIKKDQLLREWAIALIPAGAKNASETWEKIAATEDTQMRIMIKASVVNAERYADDITAFLDESVSKLPIVGTIQFYGKMFAFKIIRENNTVSYAASLKYWSEKTDEFKSILDEEPLNIEGTKQYENWRQKRRNEIVNMDLYFNKYYTGKPWTSPKGLKIYICSQSLEKLSLYERIFLTPWDRYNKKRAEVVYQAYEEHIHNDDLVRASADIFLLNAMKTTQEILLRDPGAIVEGSFASVVAVEVSAIALYSVSTTVLVVLLLFYRGPVVVTGVLLGGLVVLISPNHFVMVIFGLAGFLTVFLTFKIDKKYLNYKESVIKSLKAGFVLFLTHAVIKVLFAFFDIMQNIQRGSEDMTAVLGGGSAFGLYSGVQLLFLVFLTTGGGLLAHKILQRQNALPD